MASVRSIDSALDITLDNNGRILRNIIHGADTVMSHILHFYHLAAADFVDASALGSPWNAGDGSDPAFGTLSGTTYGLLGIGQKNMSGNYIIGNYVKALNIRREAHSLGAIFSGRHPIQNAIVPGGVATLVNRSDVEKAKGILSGIRNFINQSYIPDVVTVATLTGQGGLPNYSVYWTVGAAPSKLLSYGEYPLGSAGNAPFTEVASTNMLLQRGVCAVLTLSNFNSASISEHVNYSFYEDSTDDLHPSLGVTIPLAGSALNTAIQCGPKYSWLKAPRYNDAPHEVGPLARVLASYLTFTNVGGGPQVSEINSATGPVNASGGAYDLVTLVDVAVGAVAGRLGGAIPTFGYGNLYSPLGRHAARALECKFIADAMGGSCSLEGNTSWLDALTFSTATQGANKDVAFGYTYVQIPKATKMGTGLAEAPRGALGHWITIQNKKIARYQCVVPSTWNACPRGIDNNDLGPAEAALIGVPVGTNANDAALNIARMLHPYDFCIACAVHIVNPEGKEIAKFTMDTDGSVKRL